MKSKTVLHCFGLLISVSLIVLIGEFTIASLTGFKLSPIYEILPISSVPFLAKQAKHTSLSKTAATPEKTSRRETAQIKLLLTNGSEVSGKLVSEDADWITVNIEGGIVGFHRSEISRVDRPEDH